MGAPANAIWNAASRAAFRIMAPRTRETERGCRAGFHLVYVDANMLPGWPPSFAAHDRTIIVGLRPPRVVAEAGVIPSFDFSNRSVRPADRSSARCRLRLPHSR